MVSLRIKLVLARVVWKIRLCPPPLKVASSSISWVVDSLLLPTSNSCWPCQNLWIQLSLSIGYSPNWFPVRRKLRSYFDLFFPFLNLLKSLKLFLLSKLCKYVINYNSWQRLTKIKKGQKRFGIEKNTEGNDRLYLISTSDSGTLKTVIWLGEKVTGTGHLTRASCSSANPNCNCSTWALSNFQ